MTNALRSAIKDREVWSYEALADLMRHIDQEIERRNDQGRGAAEEQQRYESEALEALERGLLGEVRCYLRDGYVIRG